MMTSSLCSQGLDQAIPSRLRDVCGVPKIPHSRNRALPELEVLMINFRIREYVKHVSFKA